MKVHSVRSEGAFEDSIEAHLLANGWRQGVASSYDRALGLDPAELVAFLEASQPQEWEQLTQRLGGVQAARERVAKYAADQLTQRGTIEVLRGVTKMNGVSLRLAFFAPANGLTVSLWERYRANRLTIVRQLHHSESNTFDSLDTTLFVNGIPTATAELKNPLTQQRVADAMKQYQRDRNPSDLIFRARAVVHFAVDPSQVYTTTRLQGEQTRFLPFNQARAARDARAGPGTQPTRTATTPPTSGNRSGTATRGSACWAISSTSRTSTMPTARRPVRRPRCSRAFTSGTRCNGCSLQRSSLGRAAIG